MNNELYRKSETETTSIIVTKEENGYALFRISYDKYGCIKCKSLLDFSFSREAMIEKAVGIITENKNCLVLIERIED